MAPTRSTILLSAFTLLGGCLGGISDAPEREPSLEDLIGTWSQVATAPHSSYPVLLSVDSGLVLVTNLHADGDLVYGKVYYWQEGAESFRHLRTFPGYRLAAAAEGSTVYVFTTEGHSSLGTDLRVERVDLQTGRVTVDPKIPDDRVRFWVSGGATAMKWGERIYVFGGCCIPAAVWSYDLNTYRFRHVSDVPRDQTGDEKNDPVTYFPLLRDGDSILVGPGGEDGEEETSLYRFHPSTATWSRGGDVGRAGGTMQFVPGGLMFSSRHCINYWNESTEELTGLYGRPKGLSGILDIVSFNQTFYVYGPSSHQPGEPRTGTLWTWSPPDFTTWPEWTRDHPCATG